MASRRCGGCTGRSLLLIICSLQLISSVERQVLDFLGQMWLPILFNFFATIFTLIGLFGIYYQRPAHLSLYILFQVVSLCWNAFVMAFYMEFPPMSRDSDILNLGTGSRSWWETNGPNCLPQYNTSTEYVHELWSRPVQVHGCLLPFYVIETTQAAVHFILSLVSFFMSIFLLVSCCNKQRITATLRTGGSVSGVPSHAGHYNMSMSYNPQVDGGTITSRGASERRSLPNSRRSMNRGKRNRSSTRSTASARRRKRIQRANHRQENMSNLDATTDEYGYASSVYQSQNQLINSHYDASSLDSFNPNGGHTNPLYYGGSINSTGSRFSLYTINPQATMERITVNDNPAVGASPPHHHQKQHPATISRHRPYLRTRSPIYVNSNETVM